jgi:divalent metal cation (Fe/Co/Zn/Cd) transporter
LQRTESSSLRRRALWLEYGTIAWNVIEALVALLSGIAAGSIALIGFGFDSSIEVLAASVVVWQLRGSVTEERERRALRLIAITFFILAAYVTVESVRGFISDVGADTSTVGIALASLSLVIMPSLAWAKRRTGERMNSRTLIADSAETFLCAWLSAILLGGLLLNAVGGWWWADPLAALGIAALAVREGVEAWQEANEDEGHVE